MTLSRRPGRKNPMTSMLETAIDSSLRQLMFCLPGKITSFDSATQLAQVECGIQRMFEGEAETIPVIESVPVLFPGDNQFYIWHQITPGETTGLIHFSQRAIDTWIDQGGPVAPHENRMLSEDDAFFIPGVRPRPDSIENFDNTGAGMASFDQNTMVQILDEGVRIRHDGEDAQSVLDDLAGVIDDTLSQLSSETVTIASGSSAGTWPLTGQAQYVTLASELQAVRSRINTLLAS